jgi:hypothetical protein
VASNRRLGWLLVLLGGGLALGVQIAGPSGVPLFDGVVVVEPYRYLHPAGDQQGDPTPGTDTQSVSGSKSPVIAAATDESPPQAQLIAMEDAFTLPSGTTELTATITPVDPVSPPTDGTIAGNVYRFAVTDQSGTPVTLKLCDNCRSLVVRAPEDVTEGTVERFADGAWIEVTTIHAGTAAMYQANLDALGDYAVITGATGVSSGSDPDLLVFGGIALAAFLVIVAGLFWYRRRPPPVPVARLGPGRGRVPTKRRGPRRPPTGRSGS